MGKRSIVGTRVAVPVHGLPSPGETLYVPAVIHSTRVLGLETSYCVFFQSPDPEVRALLPARREYRSEQIVGPGFHGIVRRLATGQRVFLTHKGREVAGTVVSPDCLAGEDGAPGDEDSQAGLGTSVLVRLPDPPVGDSNSLLERPPVPPVASLIRRRIDDLRLIESRKSARLALSDQQQQQPQQQHPSPADGMESEEGGRGGGDSLLRPESPTPAAALLSHHDHQQQQEQRFLRNDSSRRIITTSSAALPLTSSPASHAGSFMSQ